MKYEFIVDDDSVYYVEEELSQSGKNYFVSPLGSDQNDGSEKYPFFSVEKAKKAVREYKRDNPDTDIYVYFRNGEYFLDDTVVFDASDGGSDVHKITYANYPNENPVFHSTIKVEGWQKLRDNIWQAKIPGELKDIRFRTLYKNGKMLKRGSSDEFITKTTGQYYGTDYEHLHIDYPEGLDFSGIENPQDLELMTMTAAPWAYAVLPVKNIDCVSKGIDTAFGHTYTLGKPIFWDDLDKVSKVENHVSFLKNQDEWAVDFSNNAIYIYSETRPDGIFAPKLTEYFRISDDNRIVKNLHFKGLNFRNFDRYDYYEDFRGYELQHAWSLYAYPTAAIRFRGAENCSVANCEITQGGSDGVRLDLYCQNIRVENNHIYDIGGSGVMLSGYGAGKCDFNHHNVISNNYIHNIGLIYKQSIGIYAWQSGYNLISNNIIHDTPYTAIVISSRIVFVQNSLIETSKTVRYEEIDTPVNTFEEQKQYLFGWNNVVEYNNIFNVCNFMIDGNAIYISGTGDNNIVRRNYIHDIDSKGFVGAIRADDNQYYTEIEENIIYNTGSGCGIENKQINYVKNNFLIDLKIDKRFWFSYLSNEVGPCKGTVFSENICYDTQDNKLWYNQALYGEQFDPFDIELKNNLYYSTVNERWGKSHLSLQKNGNNETGSMFADPKFYNVENRDFRILPYSPAFDLGVKQFDLSKIGTKRDYKFVEDDTIDKIYIYAGDKTTVCQLEEDKFVRLSISAKNSLGQFVSVEGLKAEFQTEDPDIAYFNEKGFLVGKRKGMTFATVNLYRDGKKYLSKIAVIVGEDDDNLTNEFN